MDEQQKIRQTLSNQQEALQEEIEKLNRLAEQALAQGHPLAEDERLLRQSKLTDEMILSVQRLQSMLEEYDNRQKKKTEE